MSQADALARLLNPRSIAIAGASPDARSMGGTVLANCERFGFSGPLHLISPTRDEIGGIACIKSAEELPDGVDAAVLNVPRAAIRPMVEACAARGVGGVVVFASGFAEAGEEGRKDQDAVAAICREAGMAMLGPNCLGFVNFAGNIALTFEPVQPVDLGQRRSVAIIAQSGATASGIRTAMRGRGISVSLSVATGNEAVIDSSDLIHFIVAQGTANAIGIYAEQIANPRNFLDAARKARTAGIPIVLLHPGRSKRGMEAAASHTGAMAGDFAMMKVAARNEGVVAVDTMDELYDTLAILHRYPAPPPGGFGVVTNSGAIRGLCYDFAEDVGFEIAEIADATRTRLASYLPEGMEIDNPLDVGTTGFMSGEIYGQTGAAMLEDPAVSGVLLPMASGAPPQQLSKAEYVVPVALASGNKPVVMALSGDEAPLDEEFMALMWGSETPLFRSTERAMRALTNVASYAKALAAMDDRTAPASGLTGWQEPGVKTEYIGKKFLSSLGIAVPEGDLATTLIEALAVSGKIGFPLVLKAQAAALSHKSDVGGVILNLKDETELRAGWDRLMANLKGAAIDGVLVERMSAPGLEMIVGARAHPEWGASVLVGLGGVWTEALDASILLPADISHARAMEKIHTLKGAKLLGPFRGAPARDVAALADVVVKIGGAMRAGIGITEIDINPLMLMPQGEGAIALDALIVTE